MFKYVLKRLLVAIPLLLGMALLTFVLMQVSPGNYLDTLRMDPQISEDTLKRYEELYQINKPLWYQFIHWLKSSLSLFLLFRHFNRLEPFFRLPEGNLLGCLRGAYSRLAHQILQ